MNHIGLYIGITFWIITIIYITRPIAYSQIKKGKFYALKSHADVRVYILHASLLSVKKCFLMSGEWADGPYLDKQIFPCNRFIFAAIYKEIPNPLAGDKSLTDSYDG